MLNFFKICVSIILVSAFTFSILAQRKSRKSLIRKPVAVSTPIPQAADSVKKNERPADETVADETNKEPQKTNQNPRKNERPAIQKSDFQPDYVYEFSQPDFVISKLTVEHDAGGKGKISFLKQGIEEPISDPIQLSAVTMGKLEKAFQAVNYLADGVDYQYEKDYSHLGNIVIKLNHDGQLRTTKFNYTTDKNAKTLADEYRRVGQQFIWIFDMNVARENQPLDTPRMMDALDSLLTRSEISDPAQMSPFLKKLSNDERLPLIARNHAARLTTKIEKGR